MIHKVFKYYVSLRPLITENSQKAGEGFKAQNQDTIEGDFKTLQSVCKGISTELENQNLLVLNIDFIVRALLLFKISKGENFKN